MGHLNVYVEEKINLVISNYYFELYVHCNLKKLGSKYLLFSIEFQELF